MKGYVDAKRNNERRDGYDCQPGEWPLGGIVRESASKFGGENILSIEDLVVEWILCLSERTGANPRIASDNAAPRCMLGRAGTIIFRECPRIVLSARLTIRLTSNCLDIFCWIMSHDYRCCTCSRAWALIFIRGIIRNWNRTNIDEKVTQGVVANWM